MPRAALTKWLRLPGPLTVLLGLGAVSTAAGPVDAAGMRPDRAAEPKTDTAAGSSIEIRAGDGRIYLSERGGAFHELSLRDTPEARRFLGLLEQSGSGQFAVGAKAMLMAGDGGNGFYWAPARDRNTGAAAKTRARKTPQSVPRDASAGGGAKS